ncbi:MAG: hypothetical protein HQM03_09360 [Magnetococcales bacterium]|nr:hypothetical protein [Magnetococcales bacterium]
MNENAKSLEKIKAPAPANLSARQSSSLLWSPGKGFTHPPGSEPRGTLSERVADLWRRLEPLPTPALPQPTPAPRAEETPDTVERAATPDLSTPLYVLRNEDRPAGRGGWWWLVIIVALLGIGQLLRMTGAPVEEAALPQPLPHEVQEKPPVPDPPPATLEEQPPAPLPEPVVTPPANAPEPDKTPPAEVTAPVPEQAAAQKSTVPVQKKPLQPAPAKPKAVPARSVSKPKTRPPALANPPAAKASPAPVAAPAAPEPRTDFVVAYGCFSNAEELARRVERIQARGWPVLTSHYTLAQTVMTCLFGGPFGNPHEANRATDLFDEKGCMQLPKTPLQAP